MGRTTGDRSHRRNGSPVRLGRFAALSCLKSRLHVLQTIKNKYGKRAWSRYGFVDAFNPLTNWYDTDVIGIDMGITMVMAENARTGFVWETFMKNPEAQRGMDRAGLKTYQAAQPKAG